MVPGPTGVGRIYDAATKAIQHPTLPIAEAMRLAGFNKKECQNRKKQQNASKKKNRITSATKLSQVPCDGNIDLAQQSTVTSGLTSDESPASNKPASQSHSTVTEKVCILVVVVVVVVGGGGVVVVVVVVDCIYLFYFN
jgi:hypothetical protein